MQELKEKGVTILSNVYTPEQILAFQRQYTKKWEDISAAMEKCEWRRIKYKHLDTPTFFLDKALYQDKEIANIDGNIVIKLGNGRYNFDGGFATEQFVTPQIQTIITHFLKRNYTVKVGGLPLSPGAGEGHWHRDIGSLYEDEAVDLAVPPFYMTMIVPLTNMTKGSGCTEFIPGSHLFNFTANGIDSGEKLREWAINQQRISAEMRPGDVALFSGLIVHRGTANYNEKLRDAIFIVFRKNWYADDNSDDYNLIL